MSQGLCEVMVAGDAPKAGHRQSLAGPLPGGQHVAEDTPTGLNLSLRGHSHDLVLWAMLSLHRRASAAV